MGIAATDAFAKSFTQVDIIETPWALSFINAYYDEELDQTIFSYEMIGNGWPGLNHWVLQLPGEDFAFVGADPVAVMQLDQPDPTTGLTGLK